MKWIKSGIENPSKSEVIVAGMKKRMTKHNRQKSNAKQNLKNIYILHTFNFLVKYKHLLIAMSQSTFYCYFCK